MGEDNLTSVPETSTLKFASRVVGNMGASLNHGSPPLESASADEMSDVDEHEGLSGDHEEELTSTDNTFQMGDDEHTRALKSPLQDSFRIVDDCEADDLHSGDIEVRPHVHRLQVTTEIFLRCM